MRVLFISKPVVPPFSDGTKCLVRDIALNLERVQPIVLGTPNAPPLTTSDGLAASGVEFARVYAGAGSYAPAMVENLRAAAWVLVRSRADAWHFVFAPNARTSAAGRWLKRLRRVPVVQTIASPPRSFEDVDALLFGDIIVAQSRWTRDQVLSAYARKALPAPDLRVIPPPVALGLSRSAEHVQALRDQLRIPAGAPYFVYPGDLETSRGASVTAELAERIRTAIPGAIVVFAYRGKTPEASAIADQLRARLDPSSTRVVGSIPDILALVLGARALVFPVDDLWGKVDLPIVLLEAMVLGTPVVAYGLGPLSDLSGVRQLETLEPEAWLSALLELERDPDARRRIVIEQRRAVEERNSAPGVAKAYEELYLELFARSAKRDSKRGVTTSIDG